MSTYKLFYSVFQNQSSLYLSQNPIQTQQVQNQLKLQYPQVNQNSGINLQLPKSNILTQRSQLSTFRQSQTGNNIDDQVFAEDEADKFIQEELSIPSKLSLINWNMMVGFLMLIIATGHFIYCLFQQDSKQPFVIYQSYHIEIIFGIFMIIFSLMQLYWSFSSAKEIVLSTSPSVFGKSLHLFGVLLFGLELICILVCFMFVKIAPQIWKTDFYQKYLSTLLISQILFEILLGFVIYSSYQMNRRPSTSRFNIYIISVCSLILAFYLLQSGFQLIKLIKIHNLESFLSNELIIALLSFTIIATVILFFLCFINYSKSRVMIFYLGSMLIMLTLMYAIIIGQIYRQSLSIQQEYTKQNSQQCITSLNIIHQDLLEDYNCKKYYDIQHSPYLSCSHEQSAIQWEAEINTPIAQKQNKVACLNSKCCQEGALIINGYLLKNLILDLALAYCLFFITLYCFFLIPKQKFEYNLPRQLEQLLIILFLVLFATGIIILFFKKIVISNVKDTMILGEQIIINKEPVENIYLSNLLANNIKCDIFTEQLTKIQQREIDDSIALNERTKFELPSEQTGQWLRTQLLVKNAKIELNQKSNNKDLQILTSNSKDIIKGIYPNIDDNEIEYFSFLLIQGKTNFVVNFIKTQVYICRAFSSNRKIQMYIKNTMINKEQLQNANSGIIEALNDKDITLNEPIKDNYLKTPPNKYFTNIKIQAYSILDSLALSDVIINLSSQSLDQCPEIIEENKIIYKAITNSKGQVSIQNIQSGKYFVQYQKEGYHTNCVQILTNEIDEITLGLIPLLKQNQMGILISYEKQTQNNDASNTVLNTLDLNLYGAFANEGHECIVSKSWPSCGGMNEFQLTKKVLKKTKQAENQILFLTVDLTKQNYLFYLKNIITFKDYQGLTTAQKQELNNLFIESRPITFSLFVSGIVHPVEFKLTLSINNEQARSEKDLVLILGCVQGTLNNKFNGVYKYWMGNSITGYPKLSDQQFPNPIFCQNYQFEI